jgi:hypothetical protein
MLTMDGETAGIPRVILMARREPDKLDELVTAMSEELLRRNPWICR